MSTIIREVQIEAPQDKVWRALADFGNIAWFNPGVPQSYVTSEQREGIGATRQVNLQAVAVPA